MAKPRIRAKLVSASEVYQGTYFPLGAMFSSWWWPHLLYTRWSFQRRALLL